MRKRLGSRSLHSLLLVRWMRGRVYRRSGASSGYDFFSMLVSPLCYINPSELPSRKYSPADGNGENLRERSGKLVVDI